MFLPDVCSQNHQPGRLQHLPFPTSVCGGILTSERLCKSCSLSSFLPSEYSTLPASPVLSSSQQHRNQNDKKQNRQHQQIQLKAIAASCQSLFSVTNRQHLCTEQYERAPPPAVMCSQRAPSLLPKLVLCPTGQPRISPGDVQGTARATLTTGSHQILSKPLSSIQNVCVFSCSDCQQKTPAVTFGGLGSSSGGPCKAMLIYITQRQYL